MSLDLLNCFAEWNGLSSVVFLFRLPAVRAITIIHCLAHVGQRLPSRDMASKRGPCSDHAWRWFTITSAHTLPPCGTSDFNKRCLACTSVSAMSDLRFSAGLVALNIECGRCQSRVSWIRAAVCMLIRRQPPFEGSMQSQDRSASRKRPS